jgi:glycosyltransferase involved in cell wall biosynthesis
LTPARLFILLQEPYARLGDPPTRNSRLIEALGRHHEIVGLARPEVDGLRHWINVARHVHPRRAAWRHRMLLNSWRFRERSLAAHEILMDRQHSFDMVLQLQTLFAPGLQGEWPVAIATDNVYALTRRLYPSWSPLSPRESDRYEALEAETFRAANLLLPRSRFVADALVAHYGCDPSRILVTGGGANLVTPDLRDKRWGGGTALFVGLDFERKGGDVLLRAWPEVRRRVPHAQLRIVGPPRPRRSRVPGETWLGRLDEPAMLSREYASADVLVMASRFEPWGHVFTEAMGHGTACIAADGGAMREIVENGANGLLVQPGRPASLADALLAILGDPELAEAMGRRAHRRILEFGTWDAVAERIAPRLGALAGSDLSEARAKQ